jgi:hypothetical protein
MARTCPATLAEIPRGMRNGDDAYLSGLGHDVKWSRWRVPRWLQPAAGWAGRCQRCGDVLHIATLGGTAGYSSYEDADGKPRRIRRCRGRR